MTNLHSVYANYGEILISNKSNLIFSVFPVSLSKVLSEDHQSQLARPGSYSWTPDFSQSTQDIEKRTNNGLFQFRELIKASLVC